MNFRACAAFVVCVLPNAGARDHERGCDGKPVPASIKSSCCGLMEAHLLSPSQIHQDGGGFWHVDVDDYHFVMPPQMAAPSPDDCMWIFFDEAIHAPSGEPHVTCFFIPLLL
jgi:hypothetical protein